MSKGLRFACVCLLCSDTWGAREEDEEEDEAGFGGVVAAAAHMDRIPIGVIVMLVLLPPSRV